MSKKTTNTPLACAIGAALVGSLTSVGVANASDNPFGMNQLESGYMQVAMKEGTCGEGKCGGDMKKKAEGTCGGDMKKKAEGTCGGDMKKKAEGTCGGDMKKKAEGTCGGSMKSKVEGTCGEGKCGGKK